MVIAWIHCPVVITLYRLFLDMHYKEILIPYRIDVTEAQWLIIIVEIVSFVCGVDVWTIVVSKDGLV